jgi:hypothetical protein
METSSLKGLEFLVIVGAVAWFYFSQMSKLNKAKQARTSKPKNDADDTKPADQAPKA